MANQDKVQYHGSDSVLANGNSSNGHLANQDKVQTHSSDTILANHNLSNGHLTNQEKELSYEEAAESDAYVDIDNTCLTKAPDGGWGWWIVVGSWLVHVLMGGFERSSGIVYLQLLDRFGQTATATSWVISLSTALRLIMGPLASALCNRFSCRTVCAVGALLSTVGAIISVFAQNLSLLYFGYGVVLGVGRSLVYTPCLIIVGYYFNKRRGIAVGLATSGGGIGTFVFPALVEILFQDFGYFGAFLILGAIISNFFVCSALFRPLDLHRKICMKYILQKRQKKNNSADGSVLLKKVPCPVSKTDDNQTILNDQDAANLASSMELSANLKIESRKTPLLRRKVLQIKQAFNGTHSSKEEKKPLLDLSLFKNFAFTTLCVQLFLFALAYNITFVFLPAYAKEMGLTQMQGAFLVSIMGINDAWARFIISFILDLKKVKPYRLIIYNILFLLKGFVAMVIPMARTFWQFALVCAMYGVLSGACTSQGSVVIVDILGVESLTSSLGLSLMFKGLGSLIGPTVGALFKDYLGSYTMSFYVGSIGIFVGGIQLAAGNVWLHRQHKRNKEHVRG